MRPLLVLALLASAPALAGDRIHTVVLSKFEGRCTVDLGWLVDTDKPALQKRAREQFPEAKSVSHKDNHGKKDVVLGRHLVVVSATVKNSGTGCSAKWYGVGFGAGEAAALKDALGNLAKRSVWFDRRRDTYEKEHSQAH